MIKKSKPASFITLYFSKEVFLIPEHWIKLYGKSARIIAQLEDAYQVMGNNFGILEKELLQLSGFPTPFDSTHGTIHKMCKFCIRHSNPLEDKEYLSKKLYVCYWNWDIHEWWFHRQPHATEILYPQLESVAVGCNLQTGHL